MDIYLIIGIFVYLLNNNYKVGIKTNISMVHDLFINVVNAYNEAEKIPITLPDGSQIFKSELHTIVEIGKCPGINVTELANKLSITKGAISQISKKLEKKSLIFRTKDFDNNKEIKLSLSEKGVYIYKKHNEMMIQMGNKIESKLGTISNDNYKFLNTFLKEILNHIKK